MIALLALWAGALAAEPAHYHPDDVAKESKVFAGVAESMGPAFEDRQGKIAALGQAVTELELGVAMLGTGAPAELRAWYDKTRRKVVGETLRLQRHVDLLGEDYSKVFSAAVDRALPTVGKGYDVKQCGATGVVAMMGRKNCAGTDLNPALGKAIDADAALKGELASIAAVEWPSFEVAGEPQPVVALTGTTRWVSGGDVAERLIGARIKDRQDALESELERMLPDEPAEEDLKKAQARKDAYLAELGKDGEALRAAITAALTRGEKKSGLAQVGWCANPAELGGCAGEDVTAKVLDMLAGDKKFAKDISGLVEVP